MKKEIKHIGVLGAGLVGALLSIYLRKRGYKVSLYEKRDDMRKSSADSGRSINLALSRRGIKALEDIGVIEEVEKIMLPMEGRMMHSQDGELTFQAYGKEGQYINSVSRGNLNKILLEKAEAAGVEIKFEHTCKSVDLEGTSVTFKTPDAEKTMQFDLLFGSDGAYSKMRQAMVKKDRFNYEQYYIPHGYKELSIPPNEDGDFAIAPNALHIWPRGQYMLIALPNLDKSFTCTLFFPFEGQPSFESLQTPQQVLNFFKNTFPDSLPHLKNIQEEYFENPTSSLVTVKCEPWVKNNCVLIGDAAHAIVPFYGQGMNAGFEDCYELNLLLNRHADDWEMTLDEYQELRKKDGDAIADLALHNFVEMRDLVADDKFLVQKKIEAKLHEKFPKKWMPLYSMVTFSDLRYSEAFEIGKKQQSIMDDVMQRPAILENWESIDLEEIVRKLEE
ncbi:kynurenine 3-monooxygenase [Marivirga tractuosa]|uniref:Kynurenine 3-monooxygenase n=1 Tax=Marivirga tractuosa (strain ATCC 23168 / DSM 4126 / NBRC 15989 / NCIMB 1408 / VKM B-1430 / H-43) TaxID=643867 RepID=E4TS97_MARTH|nr:NAD(P)/FAD-dependent oxidoreductase [Marivirga tractuosa]ADR22814.1 Kynurenine 3-monooxygenase [Marivirga tractuosa DSM 4126]BDD16515.1 kynurenine 3-monooxygenase [Marivirga tractuosa]